MNQRYSIAPVILLVISVFAARGVFAATQSLPPVVSVAPNTYDPLDEILYLEGKGTSNTDIDILFEKPDVGPVRVSVQVNANGEWFFAQRLELANGDWMVRARTLSNPPSEWSNPRIIRSKISGLTIGSFRIKYWPIVLFLLLSIGGAISLFFYALIKVRAAQRFTREQEIKEKTMSLERALREKEKESAENLVKQHFEDLRRTINEELVHLEEKIASGPPSKEEMEHRAYLLRKLQEAEKAIGNKIDNTI